MQRVQVSGNRLEVVYRELLDRLLDKLLAVWEIVNVQFLEIYSTEEALCVGKVN